MKKITGLLAFTMAGVLSFAGLSLSANADSNYHWETGTDGKSYWFEDGLKQGTYTDEKGVLGDGEIRGREIYDPSSDGWYWLDACYDGAKAVNKEVWMPYIFSNENSWKSNSEIVAANAAASGSMASQVIDAIADGSGKWVRYDENGKMIKGWYTVPTDSTLYESQRGNTYYYDESTGLMAKGELTLDGITYKFDTTTGALISGKSAKNEWRVLEGTTTLLTAKNLKNTNEAGKELLTFDSNDVLTKRQVWDYAKNSSGVYYNNLYTEYGYDSKGFVTHKEVHNYDSTTGAEVDAYDYTYETYTKIENNISITDTRITKEMYCQNGYAVTTTTYTYGAAGKDLLYSVIKKDSSGNETSKQIYVYNSDGVLTKIEEYENGTLKDVINYLYNTDGTLSSTNTQLPTGSYTAQTTYLYNTDGKKTYECYWKSVSGSLQKSAECNFVYENGNLKQLNRYNYNDDGYTKVWDSEDNYTYTSSGLVASMHSWYRNSSGSKVYKTGYYNTYDGAGNKTETIFYTASSNGTQTVDHTEKYTVINFPESPEIGDKIQAQVISKWYNSSNVQIATTYGDYIYY